MFALAYCIQKRYIFKHLLLLRHDKKKTLYQALLSNTLLFMLNNELLKRHFVNETISCSYQNLELHQNLAIVLHVKFSEVFLSIVNNINNYFTLCLLVSPLGRAVQRVKTYPLEMKSCRFKVYDYQVSKSGYHLLNSLSKTRLKSSIF